MPVLHLIAGPNGAGKSTLYRYLIQPRYPQLPFVNADLHERDQLGHVRHAVRRSEAARAWADAERREHLEAGRSFVSETVFSHPSKLTLLADARARGFEVALYVVCLDDARRLLDRVQQRVHEGGHDVPADKILARYPRTLDNLRLAVREVQLAMLFDAAEVEAGGPHLVASVVAGQIRPHGAWMPAWVHKVLGSPVAV
ncbi:zeta toxin family protein [Variovorax sp. KK3]|uniref:zeta toxin family protein n=1 Tax=Variovorax sp. KK3 TaxID=1855728 RepID=UPI00097BC4CA|nr:zeta toxin family protein [Variovorax sp. KK3]